MNIILSIIISGFVLLILGSPNQFAEVKHNIAGIVHQITERTSQSPENDSSQNTEPVQHEHENTAELNTSTEESSPRENTGKNATSQQAVSTPDVTPDFSNVGEQEDISASEVLADQTPASDSSLAKISEPVADSQPDPLVHKDRYTLAETHAANADALQILDRITKNYP